MARRNDKLRASLLEGRVAEYETAGLDDHRNANFARDMIARVARGAGYTPAQRRWVNSIIDEPVPVAADPTRYARITAAAAVEGLKPRTKDILLDFSRKVFNGWGLSEKQDKFLGGLLAEAESCAATGPWLPITSEIKDLHTCVALGARYGGSFLGSHPGFAKALRKAVTFCDLEPVHGVRTAVLETGLDEWCMNKLFKQFKTPLAELASPKHPVGETRYFVESVWNVATQRQDATLHLALVIDEPIINSVGAITYPVIVNGEMKNLPGNLLGKRRPAGHAKMR